MLYRVKNWNETFESNQARGRIKGALSWVRIPTTQGTAYRRLMRLPNAAATYGVWVAIVCVAAQQAERGLLARSDGSALSADDLEDLTGIPADEITRAIQVLASPRIGWLVRCADSADQCADSADQCADSADQCADSRTKPQNLRTKPQNLRDRGEERRGEERTERRRAREAHDVEQRAPDQPEPKHPKAPPADEDVFPPAENDPPAKQSPQAHFPRLRALGVWIPRSDRDEEGDREALAALIEAEGIEIVHAVAEQLRAAGQRRIYLGQLSDAILDRREAEKPAQPDPCENSPAPECVTATALLDRIGFDAMQALPGGPWVHPHEGIELLRKITENNKPAARDILEAYRKAQERA